MQLRRCVVNLLVGMAVWVGGAGMALASAYHGQVVFNGLPLPGSVVSVTATQGDKKAVAVSDDQGLFGFADLADGKWELDIEMTGFAPLKQEITVAPGAAVATFEMKLMSLAEIRASSGPIKVDTTAPAPAETASAAAPGGEAPGTGSAGAPAPPPPEPVPESTAAQANDGFLINGSVNNAATSQYSLNQAFGNSRHGRWLYNGGLSLQLNSSVLNAKPFSLSGQDSAEQSYNNLIVGAQIGGPLQIPHLLRPAQGLYFQFSYQRTQSRSDSTESALMPTLAMDGGDLSAAPNVTAVYAPLTGLSQACLNAGVTPGAQFVTNGVANVIPAACISPAAQVLLAYYPQPNVNGSSLYNYQLPLAGDTHADGYSLNLQKQIGGKNSLNGSLRAQSQRSSTPSIFGFLDTNDLLNLSVNPSWYHRLSSRLSFTAGYSFSRSRSVTNSYFANRTNVSALAGITDNDQDPKYWGPPSLGFSSGISPLSDGIDSSYRPETNAVSLVLNWNRFRHNMSFGGDYRRQEYNYLTQANPRGSLYFSGLATQSAGGSGGSDFADFLLGVPDTSAIAYGNADKYLRTSAYDVYANDDFRVSPELTINAGFRWEYGAPITELKNRLVNLDVAPGFTNEAPVVATDPKGPVTGAAYPTSLVRPDYTFPDPRIGLAWRPIAGFSLLVRAGYGIYNDTSLYQSSALAMAQQAPLSTSLSVANSAGCQFNILNSFEPLQCATTTPDTFAVDPHFRVGYAQQWELSVQRDLPFSLQMLASYTGIKGTHGVQEIVPNSYAPGFTSSPYGTAPVGYYYRGSGGNSTREAGSIQLRRRLRNGFTANLVYTYAKAIDDDYSLGGQGSVTSGGSGSAQIAQDWMHPAAQRGLSTFDQRNVLNAQLQYTTGVGLGGHTLLSGWRGVAYKEWTVVLNLTEASGMPETPIDPGVLPGTSFNNILRANYVGGPVHKLAPGGLFLNPEAYANPTSGFGNAGRDSITGPSQFTLNAQMQRGFRIHERYTLTAQIDATNLLNHVAYTGWNTTVGPLFGTAAGAGGMRTMLLTLRARF